MKYAFCFRGDTEAEARKGYAEEYGLVPIVLVRRSRGYWYVRGELDVSLADMVAINRRNLTPTPERCPVCRALVQHEQLGLAPDKDAPRSDGAAFELVKGMELGGEAEEPSTLFDVALAPLPPAPPPPSPKEKRIDLPPRFVEQMRARIAEHEGDCACLECVAYCAGYTDAEDAHENKPKRRRSRAATSTSPKGKVTP